jgi:hypothetical protein
VQEISLFINPNASPDEIVKSGEEVNASLYGDIIYEGLDLLSLPAVHFALPHSDLGLCNRDSFK